MYYEIDLEDKKTDDLKLKFVLGIVDVDPNLSKEESKDNHYSFWEIDTIDQEANKLVIQTYEKYSINFVEHRTGKGWHYFGEKIHYTVWKEWHQELVKLVGNKEFPALTLRITRKFDSEVFERPIYHQVTSPPQDHHRALMHFLNKEMKRQNTWNLKKAVHATGLERYYKIVCYPLCPICLVSGFGNTNEHVRKVHGVELK